MQLLQWKPSYSLGIASVDLEHREMISTINCAYDTLQNDHNEAEVNRVLGEIHAQISAHFALEERLMRTAGYAEYTEHKNSHEQLLDEIRDLMDSFSADPVAGRELLQESLANWFSLHFATFDARLHLHL